MSIEVIPPTCADCGSAECYAVGRGDQLIWLCGSCEFLRLHPDAPLRKVQPGLPFTWRGRWRKQRERLFDET